VLCLDLEDFKQSESDKERERLTPSIKSLLGASVHLTPTPPLAKSVLAHNAEERAEGLSKI